MSSKIPEVKSQGKNSPTLCVLYGVFGLPKDVKSWHRSEILNTGDFSRTFRPDVLGSSPRPETQSEARMTALLHAAMSASLPDDVDVHMGESQPACINHSFVLQQSGGDTLYGVALKVWSKADPARCALIDIATGQQEARPCTTYWTPYVLCFLSPYPLYSLLGSYVRAMWIHWSKSTNLFHAEEVGRILAFPAPRLQDLVRIDMKDYALIYQFPSRSSDFQNFDLWPIFSCLSISQIAGLIETALAPQGKIIFVSAHLAMLNVAAETIRFLCRGRPWSGLYAPVVHRSAINKLAQECGPYILGASQASCRMLTPPKDVMIVDLDRGRVTVQAPPMVFAKVSSREKFIGRLAAAVGPVQVSGVPAHLREAYAKNQLTPEGQIIAIRGRIEVIEAPKWWNQAAVLAEVDRVCFKVNKAKGLRAVLHGPKIKDFIKVPIKDFNELQRDNRRQTREVNEAWTNYCRLKSTLQSDIVRLGKENDSLLKERVTWQSQFEKFQAVAQDLTHQSFELKKKLDTYKLENKHMAEEIKLLEKELDRSSALLHQSQKEREQTKEMYQALVKEKGQLVERLHATRAQNTVLVAQRTEVESVLTSLRSLIETQPAALVEMITNQDTAAPAPATTSAHHQSRSVECTLGVDTPMPASPSTPKSKDITDLIQKITAECLSAIDSLKTDDDQKTAASVSCARSVNASRAHSSMDDANGLLNKRYQKVTASMPEIRV